MIENNKINQTEDFHNISTSLIFMLILAYLTMPNAWLDQINMTTWTLCVLGDLGNIFQTFQMFISTTMAQLVKKEAS